MFRHVSWLYPTALFVLCGAVYLITGYLDLISLPAFAEDSEPASAVADQPSEMTPSAAEVWDSVDTTGVEEELVETIYDADEGAWVIVGERGFGVRMYGAPEFQVPMRKWEDIPMFPCSDCHKKMEINYTPRELKKKHADLLSITATIVSGARPATMAKGWICWRPRTAEVLIWTTDTCTVVNAISRLTRIGSTGFMACASECGGVPACSAPVRSVMMLTVLKLLLKPRSRHPRCGATCNSSPTRLRLMSNHAGRYGPVGLSPNYGSMDIVL